jgi:hypothetical protein
MTGERDIINKIIIFVFKFKISTHPNEQQVPVFFLNFLRVIRGMESYEGIISINFVRLF